MNAPDPPAFSAKGEVNGSQPDAKMQHDKE
jgi:hypothetical protein